MVKQLTSAYYTMSTLLRYYGLTWWFPAYVKRVEELNNHSNTDHDFTDPTFYTDSLYVALAAIPGTVIAVFLIKRIGVKVLLGRPSMH